MTHVSAGNLTCWLSLIDTHSEYPTTTTQGSQGGEIAWRIEQMVFSVSIPTLFVYEIAALFLGPLPQTPIDGGSAASAGE